MAHIHCQNNFIEYNIVTSDGDVKTYPLVGPETENLSHCRINCEKLVRSSSELFIFFRKVNMKPRDPLSAIIHHSYFIYHHIPATLIS